MHSGTGRAPGAAVPLGDRAMTPPATHPATSVATPLQIPTPIQRSIAAPPVNSSSALPSLIRANGAELPVTLIFG